MSAHDDNLDPDRHLWPAEPPECYMEGQEVIAEFFSVEVSDTTQAQFENDVARVLYKATSCGAWIEFHDWGIRLGSIVEGADIGTATYPLHYADKFTSKDIQDRIDAIEAEASAIWDWANEPCDKNGKPRKNGSTTQAELGFDCPDVDFEYRHLDPDGRSS